MFKAIISDARLWRSLLSAISTLVDEATFNLTPKGMTLRSMDPSHVAMVDFEWPSAAFKEYTSEGDVKVRMNLNGMLKLLKRAKSDEMMELGYDPETRKVNMTVQGAIKKAYSIPTLEAKEEETPTPKLELKSKVKLTSGTLREVIEDTQEVSDNVNLETEENRFIVSAATSMSSARFEIKRGSEALIDLVVKEPSKATFNLNYLLEMVKAGSSTSEISTLEFSTNMPLKLEFPLIENGRLSYYLAPRIDAE